MLVDFTLLYQQGSRFPISEICLNFNHTFQCESTVTDLEIYICTNNLTGLVTMRLFGNGLDNVLRNMIDDGINVICDRDAYTTGT